MDSSKIEDLLVKDDNFMDLLLFDIEKVRRNGGLERRNRFPIGIFRI